MYRVLVVEDEPWIRKATVKMIENIGSGFEVVGEAENGEEAWSMIQTLWPSIVIADIMMPEKDGLALIEQIQARNYPIVTIIISGFDNFQYAQKAIRYGVTEYLLKPLSESDLKDALLRSINRLKQLQDVYQHFVHIEDFIYELPEYQPDQLVKRSQELLSSLLRLKGRHDGIRTTLCAMLFEKWEQILKDIYPKWEIKDMTDSSDSAITERMQSILHQWLNCYPEMMNFNSTGVIHKLCKYIQEHYKEELTITDLAAKANLSVAYFSVLFKKHAGDSFVNYLNATRVMKAKELLISDMKIYQVASEVGFMTVPYFNRVFKQTTGLSPNEYRKKLGL
ncbi:response regulator transcription factor [Paenibacillus qinlingensis]|uniref:response regulator transcription factor n=1 Tax=Paenibacillus qinlingensis TaxID=1837343 RepID=UPI0015638644|nr:response regulator [Paenibacillus qinlingensis]NQX62765.1 response regulator [Paenibacillus qinlingensis]